jgi:D-alanine-D-alanine ligase
LCAFHGIPQVDFCEAGEEGWRERVVAMGIPVWVKPSRLGSSVGISKVSDPGQLDEAVAAARRHDPRVIVEAHCEGREIECSVIGNEEPETSLPGEIDAHADWYDFEAKYEKGGMDLIVPARLDEEMTASLRSLAARTYRAIGGTGLARCDFFVTEAREILVNELNTIPGFTATSVFAKLFEATGISYAELCDRLVRLAVERHADNRRFEF